MSETAAYLSIMREFRVRFDELNAIEECCGLPPIQEQDWSWVRRAVELERRLALVSEWARSGDELAYLDVALDLLGAHLVAMKLAVARAMDARIDTGDAA